MSFEEAREKITKLLSEQWFWVLTTIDVQAKMKEKLWKNMEEYIILWACNPKFAYEALEKEISIWLLLPCNLLIYKKLWTVYASTIVPTVALSIVETQDLKDTAQQVETKLKYVID